MKSIIIVSLLLFCTVGGASAWYDGFDYRIPIIIDNAGNPALEHYQFNVSFSPGINETSIRVVNDTDYTIVPHWCENETGGVCYELWFNVSVGSEVNTDYYIYYGNDSIPSTSDYDSTFTKKYNDSGLVLELHMDEGGGNSVAVDSSGEGNDGTLTNMNVTGNATSGWQGTDGGQWGGRSDVVFSTGDNLKFDGNNDHTNCGHNESLNVPTFTISVWVNRSGDGAGEYCGIISRNNDVYNRILLRYRPSINIVLFFLGSGSEYKVVDSNGDLDVGTWHHLCTIYDGTNMYLYVDGVRQTDTETTTGSPTFTTQDYLIGIYIDNFFEGLIDETRIYNRTLSEDEIYRQYIRSKYAVNTPLISIGYTEEILHPFLSGAYLFYGEMTIGLTGFRDGMGRYLIWGVVFFAVSLAFALIAKIKHTLIGGK